MINVDDEWNHHIKFRIIILLSTQLLFIKWNNQKFASLMTLTGVDCIVFQTHNAFKHRVLLEMWKSRLLWVLNATICIALISEVSAFQDPQDYLKVTFALKPADGEALEKALLSISDPHHSRFRQYLSHDGVKQLVKPVDGANDAVLSWVKNT